MAAGSVLIVVVYVRQKGRALALNLLSSFRQLSPLQSGPGPAVKIVGGDVKEGTWESAVEGCWISVKANELCLP